MCLDRLYINLYQFWKHPAALFFKKNNYCFPALAKQYKKFSSKRFDLFIKYLFRPILLRIFASLKASLVVIYIMVVKNIMFTFQKQLSEGVVKYILLK